MVGTKNRERYQGYRNDGRKFLLTSILLLCNIVRKFQLSPKLLKLPYDSTFENIIRLQKKITVVILVKIREIFPPESFCEMKFSLANSSDFSFLVQQSFFDQLVGNFKYVFGKIIRTD